MIKMKLSEHYTFVAKEINNPETNQKVIAICIQDKQTRLATPHPITEFITVKYSYYGKSLNSQLVPARLICGFINFIYASIDRHSENFIGLKSSGLNGLNLYHGSDYLTHLTNNGLSRNTVLLHESVLTHFYIFLSECNYIEETIHVGYNVFNKQKTTVQSLFRKSYLQTKLPSVVKANDRVKLKDFGKNRDELIPLFIQMARSVAPDIALGICLQFFGGLRRGELVNLTRSDLDVIPYESMAVHIKDNRHLLFPHLNDTSNEFPKRINYLNPGLCKQIILNHSLLWEVYMDHKKTFLDKPHINRDAVFLNKDGIAMSGKVYDRRFYKVKKRFLKELLIQRRYEDYILLSESYWGTHIGRGVFSNILFDMGLTPTQIAIARGDTNINSSMEYVDEKTTIQAIKDHLPLLKNVNIQDIKSVNNQEIRRLWQKER